MNAFNTILRQLPHLKTSELEEVRKRVCFLLGTAPKVSNSTSDWLLEGLLFELRKRGLWAANYPLPTKLLPENYTEKAEPIKAHLLAGFSKPNLKPPERMALGVLAATVLMDYLTKINVPVSPKTVLLNIEKIQLALEESFPGYWEQKLLGFCINKG